METSSRNSSCSHEIERLWPEQSHSFKRDVTGEEIPHLPAQTSGKEDILITLFSTKGRIRKGTFLIAFCFSQALQTNAGPYTEKMSFHPTAVKTRALPFNYTSEPNHSSIKTHLDFPVRKLRARDKNPPGGAGLRLTSTKPQSPEAKAPGPGSSGYANLQRSCTVFQTGSFKAAK